jgi:hypothetical protein
MTQAQVNAAIPPFYRYTGVLPPPNQIFYVLNNSVKNFLFLTIQGVDLSVDYTLPTDSWGRFNIGGNLTYFTKFDQQFKGNPHTFSVLGTTGFNGTIASVQTQGRFHLGWSKDRLQTTVFMNYVSGYRNWSGGTVNPVVLANGVPDHGGDKVKANYTFDLNVTYDLGKRSWFGVEGPAAEVFLDVVNVFDRAPVFYNGPNGYDQFTGNPVGRVTTAGIRLNF